MKTFTYCLNGAQIQDYFEGNLNVNDIIEELTDEMVSAYITTGDINYKIYLTRYAGHSDELNETYEEDVDTLETDIHEIFSDYMEKGDLMEIIDEVVSENIEVKESLKEIVDKLKKKDNK